MSLAPGPHGVGQDVVTSWTVGASSDPAGSRVGLLGRARGEHLEHVRHGGGVVGERPGPAQVLLHLRLGRDADDELVGIGVRADVVERQDVGGVARRDLQLAAVPRHDDDLGALRDRLGDQLDELGLHRVVGQVHHLEPEDAAQGLGDVPLGRQAQVDDDLPQPTPGTCRHALHLERRSQVVLGHDAGGDQHVAEAPLALARQELGIGHGRLHRYRRGRRHRRRVDGAGIVTPWPEKSHSDVIGRMQAHR
jgi:hypothetical protein